MQKSDNIIRQNSKVQNDRFLKLSNTKIEFIEFGQFSQDATVVGIYNNNGLLINEVPDIIHQGERVKVLLNNVLEDIYIICVVKYNEEFEYSYLQSLENWD
jgi:archaellum component FlaF (FlaF/FlaG flagellin family)